jgi:hypothetical protein
VSSPIEPVIATIYPHLPEPRRAVLSDVLVVIADQQPSIEWRTDVLVRHCGLALLLVITPNAEALAHFRDGTVLALTVRPDEVFVAARSLYFSWAGGFT